MFNAFKSGRVLRGRIPMFDELPLGQIHMGTVRPRDNLERVWGHPWFGLTAEQWRSASVSHDEEDYIVATGEGFSIFVFRQGFPHIHVGRLVRELFGVGLRDTRLQIADVQKLWGVVVGVYTAKAGLHALDRLLDHRVVLIAVHRAVVVGELADEPDVATHALQDVGDEGASRARHLGEVDLRREEVKPLVLDRREAHVHDEGGDGEQQAGCLQAEVAASPLVAPRDDRLVLLGQHAEEGSRQLLKHALPRDARGVEGVEELPEALEDRPCLLHAQPLRDDRQGARRQHVEVEVGVRVLEPIDIEQ
eukprot:460722-Hanusia_phi.AAC.2